MYENEDYKKNDIIGQGRHQFIYGYDSDDRTRLLKEIEKENPVVSDIDSPMAIYVEDYGLPTIEYDKKSVDMGLVKIVSTEYFNFSVLSQIIKFYIDGGNNNKNVLELMKKHYQLEIERIEELSNLLNESKRFYKSYYEDYLKHGNSVHKIDEIKIPFIDLEMFLTELKNEINNNSYFALMIDNKKDISTLSTQVINLYVSSRINDTISMKVATDPNKWKSFIDYNGQFVEAVHDYGEVELDDSYKKMIKRNTKI